MTLEEVNKYLDSNYGRKDPNYPRFRIVHSSDCKEMQVVKRDYDYNGVIVSTSINHEEHLKYPFVKGCYIFEVHCPTDNPDIVDHAGNYEPVYVFRDKDDNPLPLDLEIAGTIANGLSTPVVRKTPGQLKSEEDERMKKATELEFAMVDDECPYIPSLIHQGEGIFLDSTKRFNGN